MTRLRQRLFTAIAATLVFAAPPMAVAADQKSILVTGAGTGIGRDLAERLDAALAGDTPAAQVSVHGTGFRTLRLPRGVGRVRPSLCGLR